MDYDDIELAAREISYRDKLRLAQLMIQLARREEEEANPARRKPSEPSLAEYAAPRLRKLKPRNRTGLLNSINAMFQFRGGITDADTKVLVRELSRDHGISIDEAGHVLYASE